MGVLLLVGLPAAGLAVGLLLPRSEIAFGLTAAALAWLALSFSDSFYERVPEEIQAQVLAALVALAIGDLVGMWLRRHQDARLHRP